MSNEGRIEEINMEEDDVRWIQRIGNYRKTLIQLEKAVNIVLKLSNGFSDQMQ